MTSKILLLTQFFPPETGAAARRSHALARALSHRHDITVVTLKPGYPSPDLFNQVDWQLSDGQESYIVDRSTQFRPHSKSLYKRAVSEIFLAIRLGYSASKNRFDVLIVTTPSMFLGPVAHFIARLKRSKVVWDVRDLTWRYAGEAGEHNKAKYFIAGLIERLMKFTLKRVDLVVGATPGISDLLIREHEVDPLKVMTIPNGVSEEFIHAFEGHAYSSGHPIQVTYVGLIGYNQGIMVMVYVAKRLPDVKFLLIGDGTERDLVQEEIEAVGLDNISLRSYVIDRDEVKKVYRESQILFAQIIDRPTLNQTALSSKLMEYMATGKPIVYAGKGLAVDFLAPIGCAEIADPENPDSIAEAIQRLINDPERAAEMGKNGREFVKMNYIREDLMQKYVEALESHILR